MTYVNTYKFTKMIYQNYVVLIYKSKNKTKFTTFGIDRYIVDYINNKYKKRVNYLKSYIKLFEEEEISYVVVKEGNIRLIKKYNDLIYLDYYYKSIIYKLINKIKKM